MNKLMIAAVAATLTVASYGSIVVTNCSPVSLDCPQVVFKLSGSGKTATGTVKSYKTVAKLKISKGALVLWGSGDGDACCYDQYSLYLTVKVGKNSYKILKPQSELDTWTVFGKNFAKADELALVSESKKSKKLSLETQIGLSHAAGDDLFDESVEDDFDENLAFFATAFGKATFKYVGAKGDKTGCSVCKPGSYDIIPASYSGWFAGVMSADGEELCLTCGCNDFDVFGGTWKAKYNKAWSIRNGWLRAASYAFGSSMAAAMRAADVE